MDRTGCVLEGSLKDLMVEFCAKQNISLAFSLFGGLVDSDFTPTEPQKRILKEGQACSYHYLKRECAAHKILRENNMEGALLCGPDDPNGCIREQCTEFYPCPECISTKEHASVEEVAREYKDQLIHNIKISLKMIELSGEGTEFISPLRRKLSDLEEE